MAPAKGTKALRRPTTTRSETATVVPLPTNAQEARQQGRARNGSVSKIVLEYGMKHPGVLLHINEIMEATGLRDEQIRSAIRKFMEPTAEGGLGEWRVELRGSAWTYLPSKPAVGSNFMMVEFICQLDEGLLVRAEDGSLAIMKPVKLS